MNRWLLLVGYIAKIQHFPHRHAYFMREIW